VHVTGGVTASIPRAVVQYLERALGPDVAAAVVRTAGLDPDDPRWDQDPGWFSTQEVAALADAAVEATGDPDIGRRAGEEHLRQDVARGLGEFLIAEGDPAGALALAVSEGVRMLPARRLEIVESGDRRVVVDSWPVAAGSEHRFLCGACAGYWAGLPGLFQAVGTVVETRCLSRGDDRCRLEVRWGEAVTPSEAELRRKRERARGLVDRFTELQAMAAELASIDEIGTALERIVARAGSTLLARRFVLTVREQPGSEPRVVAAGLDDEVASEVAALLWRGGDDARRALEVHGAPVVAAVRGRDGSTDRGFLVAFLPPGTTVREADERLLDSYAGHAGATIDRLLAGQAAQRDHRMSEALLRLAHALATARSVGEVTERVTEAVGEVTGCEVSGVWLLDRVEGCYRLQVVREDEDGTRDGPRMLRLADPSGPDLLLADPKPFVVAKGLDPTVDQILAGWGVEEAYVGPIVHRGRMYGLLATARRRAGDQRGVPAVLETVSALAHQAATAIANAELLQEIRHQATHDALTGLPNRPQIEDRAADALRVAATQGTTVALAFVDLDRFKIVNDTLGHVAGDDLIALVGERLAHHLRPADVVARLGGDEFLVLLTGLEGVAQGQEVVERVLQSLGEPFEIRGESLFVTASVGVACFPQHGGDYGTLLRRADAAMYVAKAEGRNRVAMHRAPVGGHRSRLKLESELHQAIERDELRVLYQPQVDLLTDEIIAVEALVRWQHPSLGLVGPATFLAIAEESGLVVDIDRWVRRQAFEQAATWRQDGTPVRVAVNVSRRDLADAGFAGSVQALLDALDLPPHLVELEITDRIVMSDEDLPPSLAGLRELGVRLAVDDFGTGSSVLSRLHHCPVDVLKVDRTFVEPLSRPRPDTRLVDGLVSMAHALGLEVVIEGVEDEQQAHAVRMLGAELAQGFHFHRPMPAVELTPLLQLHAAAVATFPLPRVRRRVRGGRR